MKKQKDVIEISREEWEKESYFFIKKTEWFIYKNFLKKINKKNIQIFKK